MTIEKRTLEVILLMGEKASFQEQNNAFMDGVSQLYLYWWLISIATPDSKSEVLGSNPATPAYSELAVLTCAAI